MALHTARIAVRTADGGIEPVAIDAGIRRARTQALFAFGQFIAQCIGRALHLSPGHHAAQG